MPTTKYSENAINDILFSDISLTDKMSNLLQRDDHGHNALSWAAEKNKKDLQLRILTELKNDTELFLQAISHTANNGYSSLQSKNVIEYLTEQDILNLINLAHLHRDSLQLLSKIGEALKQKRSPAKLITALKKAISFEEKLESLTTADSTPESNLEFILSVTSHTPLNQNMVEKLFRQQPIAAAISHHILSAHRSNHHDILTIFLNIIPTLTAKTKILFFINGATQGENILHNASVVQDPEVIAAILQCLRDINDKDYLLVCLKSRSGKNAHIPLHAMSSCNNPCIGQLIDLILTLDMQHQVQQLSETDSQGKQLIERENIYRHLPSLIPYMAYCAKTNNAEFLRAIKKVMDSRPDHSDSRRCYELAEAVIAFADQAIDGKETLIKPALDILTAFTEGLTQSTIPPETLVELTEIANRLNNDAIHRLAEKLSAFKMMSGQEMQQALTQSATSFLTLLHERPDDCLQFLDGLPHQAIGACLTQMTAEGIPVIKEPSFRPYLNRARIMCAMHHASHTAKWDLLTTLRPLCYVIPEDTRTLSIYYSIACTYMKVIAITSPTEDHLLRHHFFDFILNTIYDDVARKKRIDELLNYLNDLKINIFRLSELEQLLALTRFSLLGQKIVIDLFELIYLAHDMPCRDLVKTFETLKLSIQHYFKETPSTPEEKTDIWLFFEIALIASRLKHHPELDTDNRDEILEFAARFLHTVYQEPAVRQELLRTTAQSILSALPAPCQSKVTFLTGPKL